MAIPRALEAFLELLGEVFIRWNIYDSLGRKKINKWGNKDIKHLTKVMILMYEAARWILVAMFPEYFAWKFTVRFPRFWTTDAATFSVTLRVVDC